MRFVVTMVGLVMLGGCGRLSDVRNSSPLCSKREEAGREFITSLVKSSLHVRGWNPGSITASSLDDFRTVKAIHEENEAKGCPVDIWDETIHLSMPYGVYETSLDFEWTELKKIIDKNELFAQEQEVIRRDIAERLAEQAAKIDASDKEFAQEQSDMWYKQKQELNKRAPQRHSGLECRLKQWNSTRHFSDAWGNMDGAVYIVLECTNKSRSTAKLKRSEAYLHHDEHQWRLGSYRRSMDEYSDVTYPNYDVLFLSHFEELSPGETGTFGFSFYPEDDIVSVSGVTFDMGEMRFGKPKMMQ